jgi:hypothetical protein
MPKLYSSLRAGALALSLLPASLLAQNVDTLVVAHGSEAGHKVSRLTLFKTGGLLLSGTVTGIGGQSTVPAEGSGTRLMWYPEQAAFRAGHVNGTQWDDANIGSYSVAMGYNARASGNYGTAMGKDVVAAQVYSTAFGEFSTASGATSVALGNYAHTNARQGSFVFSDRSVLDDGNFVTDEAFYAKTNNSANFRVIGGFRIYTSSDLNSGIIFHNPNTTLVNGGNGVTPGWFNTQNAISTSTGAYLSGAGMWTSVSDRRKKHRFEAVSGEEVLAKLRQLPITRWSYKAESGSVRHLGPMAQDFRRLFGLGRDSVSIGSVDADGVALAGVQALDARTQALQAENAELRARLLALEQRLSGHQPVAAIAPTSPYGLPLGAGLLGLGAGLGVLLYRRRR